MAEHIETIIVGGGQGGLSISYCLKQQGREHIILDKAYQSAQAWRDRWDSFTLVTPNWMVRLPGAPYQGDQPDGFMTREEIVSFFDSYIEHFDLPIRYGVRVRSVEPSGNCFLVKTDQGDFESENVVIAVGLFQQPKFPTLYKDISAQITQIHSSQYRDPSQLPPGAVLVVGSAQSGSQIAEELHLGGRKVYLAVSTAGRIPRRYRGVDSYKWMDEMGYFRRTVDELKSPKDKFAPSAHATGKNGGYTLNLHQFAKDGMQLLGHVAHAENEVLIFAPDLKENLAKADQFESDFVKEVDRFIEDHHLDVPTETLPRLTDGFDIDEILELDLNRSGISSIIWATGYKFDFSWVRSPAFDQDGFPEQYCGITKTRGLYFIGLPFLHTGISGVIAGVGDDAEYIASDICEKKMKTNLFKSSKEHAHISPCF